MKAMSNKIMDNEPEEIEALLPWYAAGTLSERDSRRVEDALRQDAVLQKQYAVIREEYAETVALNEEFGAPSSRALQKLMAAIDAEPVRAQSAAALKRPGRFAGFFASLSPRTLAWSASFGGLALMVQAGLIGTILMRSGLEAFQSPARPGGTGLGLTIAAELVRAHGGHIRLVDSNIGATFRIEIPDRPLELHAPRDRVSA